MKPPRQFTLLLINAAIIIAALIAATLGQAFYTANVQSTLCFEYAQRKAVPNLADLDFKAVTIAAKQFRGHVCQFTDRRTGYPVSVAFDEADVPYSTDTLHVFAMIVPAVVVGIVGTAVTGRFRRT
jgi:hypothetical protein